MERVKSSRLLIMMCVFNLFLAGISLANDVVLDENGNVGIGTNAPGSKLEISGTPIQTCVGKKT